MRFIILLAGFLGAVNFIAVAQESPKKFKIMIVSSYHREYLWSRETNEGVTAALLDFKFLDNREQGAALNKNDTVESSRAIVKKLWMDTKRKSSSPEIMKTATKIAKTIDAFKPDLILFGDDNATNYLGTRYRDTEIPLVFWGLNNSPVKYGLVDTMEKPGHNVTGIFQAGYYKESLALLKKLVPSIQTFAILSDDSETGRGVKKAITKLSDEGMLPIKLAGSVTTNSFTKWKSEALKLEKQVDAFFVANHHTLKNDRGQPIDPLEAASWYLHNIKKPEAAPEKQFAEEGLLLVVDDSGYKQGYEAIKVADQILNKGRKPAEIPPYAPTRGQIIINRERAKALNIKLSNDVAIEAFIEKSEALKKYPK